MDALPEKVAHIRESAGNLLSSKFIQTLIYLFAVTWIFYLILKSVPADQIIPLGHLIAYLSYMAGGIGVYNVGNVADKVSKNKTDVEKLKVANNK